MRRVLDEYGDRLMIGEVYLPVERLVTYYGAAGNGCHLPFNFQLIEVPWQAEAIGATIDAYEAALPAHGWPNWVLGNHDKSRLATRIGIAHSRIAAMLLLTLRGTPTLYYGDELGMTDVPIAPEQVQDPWEKNVPGFGLGRDPARTPMQWDTSEQAGFTSGKPWLPLSSDAKSVNVQVERDDPTSILCLYRSLIYLRRSEEALTLGSYRLEKATDDILVYRRERGTRRLSIALNFSDQPRTLHIQHPGRILLSTHANRLGEPVQDKLSLRSYEGIIVGDLEPSDKLSSQDTL
jgi:alpha-glucosidase